MSNLGSFVRNTIVTYWELIFNVIGHFSTLMPERESPPESPIGFSYGMMVRWIFGKECAAPLILIPFSGDYITAAGAPGYLAVIMKSKCYDQGFSTLCAFRFSFPQDWRVWKYVDTLSNLYIKSNIWSCTFFISTLQERKKQRGVNNRLATTYEWSLFFMAVKNITNCHRGPIKTSGSPSAKRRKSIDRSSKTISCTKEGCKQLGFSVQTVVRVAIILWRGPHSAK